MHHPNVVVMLMDNLGYGDLECYGSTQHRTPNIDRLALTGMRLTSFYSTSGVCTPSRASLISISVSISNPRPVRRRLRRRDARIKRNPDWVSDTFAPTKKREMIQLQIVFV